MTEDALAWPAAFSLLARRLSKQVEGQMNAGNDLERCRAFVNLQLQTPRHAPLARQHTPPPVSVTISRQACCGSSVIAEKLAEYLRSRTSDPWTIFDRNLMEKVMEDHHLPTRIAEFLPEDRTSAIRDMIEELLGLHPSSRTVIYQTTETILRLVELGNAIIMGRAANAVTARLPNVVHARLIAPIDVRVGRAQEILQMNAKDARAYLNRTDQGRARYVKNFGRDVDDPAHYDILLNTAAVGWDESARLIGDLVLHRAESLKVQYSEMLAAKD